MDPVSEGVGVMCGLVAVKTNREYKIWYRRRTRRTGSKDYGLERGFPDVMGKVCLAVCAKTVSYTHLLRQFEAAACANNWTEKDLSLIHI